MPIGSKLVHLNGIQIVQTAENTSWLCCLFWNLNGTGSLPSSIQQMQNRWLEGGNNFLSFDPSVDSMHTLCSPR